MALRDELIEEHWSYMDRYEAELIARGPALVGDTPPAACTSSTCPIPLPPARSLSTSRATRPAVMIRGRRRRQYFRRHGGVLLAGVD